MSLRDKLNAKNAAIAAASDAKGPGGRPNDGAPKTAPGQLLAAMPLLAAKDKQVSELEAQNAELRTRLEKAARAGAEIPLKLLIEVPGRRRKLSKEAYVALRENLRHNKLIHPVVVRQLEAGTFEIISGHHRVDAYRELGREQIRAVLMDGSDEEATDGAFNVNLIQSGLTDYEKYLGFRIRLERTAGMTQAELAEQTGISKALVSYILSFDQLPPDVLSMVEEQPDLLGATAVAALAGFTKAGRSEQVINAVKKLVAGEIDQGQAVKLAGAEPAKTKKESATPISEKIKAGKATYCEIRRAKNVFRLEFKSEDEARRIHAAIKRLLEEEAKVASAETEKQTLENQRVK
ncbi:ParB, partition protein [Caballeronia arationis]|uniref:ParB/RepB/Spo0J family partition protein n=1 Tax=Caballeronia arationis TaxID=1777142 RepID=UPI00074B6FD2|nr:ParB/RepB/Spo0J family partition protein [Caballeronia arationis]SAL06129.1 ParB, partition protein [Caballeronia arationis]